MKVTFIGATHEVTGSCTFIEVGGENYLVDCGMRQGREVYEFAPLPVAPSKIRGVFLTHAHIDHSGMLPKLYKDGFRGKIYTTEATYELCKIMLEDSAHIIESEMEWKNRKRERSGLPPLDAAYEIKDAEAVMSNFEPLSYNMDYQISDSVTLRLTDIGHLLGSSAVTLTLTENGISKKIVFSGDVGNNGHPIISDPMTVNEADYVVVESTYGTRVHEDFKHCDPYEELSEIITTTFRRGGNLVIPSFAVGRTQELLYIIKGIKDRNLVPEFPRFPVYLDSPLSVEATDVFMKCDTAYFDEDMREKIESGINPLMNDDLVFSVTTEESRLINIDKKSKVIISSSGMCDAGRIRHHLKHNLWKAENTILFVGYQAEGSLGRVLIEGKKLIKIFGEEVAVKASIRKMHGTSAHADKNGLLNWINGFLKKPLVVFVNHGSNEACEGFKALLGENGYEAYAPFSGTELNMITGGVTPVEGKLNDNTPVTSRAQMLFNALMDSVEELENVAKNLKDAQNRDKTSLNAQIRQLIAKWKNN